MTCLPAACRRSQLIGPYMLSMSTTMWSASASGTSRQRPSRRALASANADFKAVSVAGSMPVRPRVSAMDCVRSASDARVLRSVPRASTRAMRQFFANRVSSDDAPAICPQADRATANARPWMAGPEFGRAVGRAMDGSGSNQFAMRLRLGRWFFRNAIWSARMLRLRQDQVLDPARPVRHREQRHRRLLRRAPALARVAVEAGGDHVLPGVAPALATAA